MLMTLALMMLLMPLFSMVAIGNDVPQQPQINARWLADDTRGSNVQQAIC